MFNRVFVENEHNNEFYASLGRTIIPINQVPPDLCSEDLVIFTGGTDINPLLYGETPHPTTQVQGDTLGRRDKFCVDLYHACIQAGCSVLGICRGHQHIAAMKGIKLIQDIQPSERGSRRVLFEGDFWATVPKCHHQAVPITKQLRILAETFLDTGVGFIEAFDTNNGKILCVQGHPEWCHPNEKFPSWVRNRLWENKHVAV
jgi:gamma-glutamyl-gamma-aminobutyrate hydrolase PuuD